MRPDGQLQHQALNVHRCVFMGVSWRLSWRVRQPFRYLLGVGAAADLADRREISLIGGQCDQGAVRSSGDCPVCRSSTLDPDCPSLGWMVAGQGLRCGPVSGHPSRRHTECHPRAARQG